MRLRGWMVMAAGALAAAPMSAQQLAARTELMVSSGYLWRGITRHRSPVAQLFGSVGRSGAVDLELAGWASGITGEGSGPRVADANASLLARFGIRDTRIALGANAYHFRPAPFDATASSGSTWEAVASVYAIPSRHMQFGVSAWMDLGKVDGLYAEASGTLPVTAHKARPPRLFITVTVGFNQGQNAHTDQGPVPGYFEKNGFTHISLETSYLVFRPDTAGRGSSLQVFLRAQGNLDAATKASVWPFRRAGTEQQVVLGLALHPLLAAGYRDTHHR
jgi:hypothetical protein